MNMELMQNIKGFLYLYVDGYKHTKNREGKSGRIFWRCSKRYCPGKVTTLHGRLVHKASHIHPPDRECSVTGSPGNHGDRLDEILCIKSDPDTDRIGKDMSERSFENLADGRIKILSDPPRGSKRPRLSKTCRESEEMDTGTSNINIDNVVMNRCSGASSLLQVTGSLGSVKQVVTTLNSGGRLLDMVKSVLPPLDYDQHKGQAGRIAVIGGSEEYTGAPYFAAISALKVGADLSHVFCSSDSAIVIKSYSPDLIVHPLLDQPKAVSQISEWLRRMHSLVIGPGLGRNPQVLHNVKEIIKVSQEMEIPIVIDADGLHLITEQPSVIQNYHKAILTPNVVEFARLFRKVMNDDPKEDEPVSDVSQLAAALGNVTVVRKGLNDIICDGNNVLVCCGEGSPRRCGGQGDLLSGSMAAFNYWTHLTTQSDQSPDESLLLYGPTICAAYAACSLTKEANRQAFEKHRRSTTTADMVDCIQSSFEQLYT